jgi:hypothetical protein
MLLNLKNHSMQIQKETPVAAVTIQEPRLLDQIRMLRQEIGDGLTDDDLTRLIRQTRLVKDTGFEFLSYASGFVTLCPQSPSSKHQPADTWVSAERARLAATIAAEFGLEVYEPLNRNNTYSFDNAMASMGRHFEFTVRQEPIAIAHAAYLKILLDMPRSVILRHRSELDRVFTSSILLDELARLYKASSD